MVTFLQRTFTSLVHAHAGRTQSQAHSPNAKSRIGLDLAVARPVLAALDSLGVLNDSRARIDP